MTCLFDALDSAINKLLALKLKYPAVIPRIIALTDGIDNKSKMTSADVARKII
jgi:hypothetical protein